MKWSEIGKRVAATFGQSFFGALGVSALFPINLAVWQAAVVAGGGAVVALAHRTSERWLRNHPEEA